MLLESGDVFEQLDQKLIRIQNLKNINEIVCGENLNAAIGLNNDLFVWKPHKTSDIQFYCPNEIQLTDLTIGKGLNGLVRDKLSNKVFQWGLDTF